jgi:hypothetical protein
MLAILIAARRTGDEMLEYVAREQLEQDHGITIHFREEVSHAR